MYESVPRQLVEIQGDVRERSILFWFKEYTASKAPGLFPSAFWTSLLPRASYSEPAVLHAVLALTSAHKYEQLADPGILSVENQFTLKAYSKTIRHLKPSFNLKSSASLRVTLITCILFVCLEIVQRRYTTAMSHLSNGIKLIEQSKRFQDANDAQTFLHDDESDDLIAQTLLKLSSQVIMLGYHRSQPSLLYDSQILDIPPCIFLSTAEARQYLDKLIARVFELNDLCRKQDKVQAQDALRDQSALQVDLDYWLHTFSVSGIDSGLTISPWRKACCIVLRMYHTLAVIMCEKCLFPNQEVVFDLHWEQFLRITAYAIQTRKVLEGPQALSAPAPAGETHGIIIDIGWIPALFYTAIKCRIRRIRLLAIRLLEATSHREGVWDATVAAQVAREVIRMEEKDEHDSCVDETLALDSIPSEEKLLFPTLSESQRLHDVEIVFPDELQDNARFQYRKEDEDGLWREVWREYDPVSDSWSDIVQ
jgi:hypothetical protein